MTRDTTASFGVTRTIVRNLTSAELFISWWPEKYGEGRLLRANETAYFNGNLFEALYAWPRLRAAMEADVQAGRAAVAACGAPEEVDKYPIITQQPHPGMGEYACIVREYYSSSSAFICTFAVVSVLVYDDQTIVVNFDSGLDDPDNFDVNGWALLDRGGGGWKAADGFTKVDANTIRVEASTIPNSVKRIRYVREANPPTYDGHGCTLNDYESGDLE